MRKLGLLLSIFLVLTLSTVSRAQLTKSVITKAGTPEDKALDDYRRSLFLKVPSFALWTYLSAKITQFLDWSWKSFLRDFVAVV